MKVKLVGALILLLGITYGCSESLDNESVKSSNTGTVTISLTDAPFPMELVEEANVVIDWVKLKLKQIENEGGDEQDASFIILDVQDTFNLVELINGEKTILGILDSIPTGEYSEIRMHVVDASILLVEDGGEFDLKIPSGSSSGLKIKIKPTLIVEEGSDSEILLDFDASRSFKAKGNWKNMGKGNGKGITGFMFNPVIRASNLSETGTISGVVIHNIGEENVGVKNAHLYLTTGEDPDIDTITGTKTEIDGSYKIIGVPAGFYDLICEKEEYTSDAITNLEVKVGETTIGDFSIDKEESDGDEE